MQKTIDETSRRRMIQMKYNEDNNITPQQIVKGIKSALHGSSEGERESASTKDRAYVYLEPESATFAADPIIMHMSRAELEKSIENTKQLMEQAAKELDFIQAAQYRDEMLRLQGQLEQKV